MGTKYKVVGFILEQYDKILVECKDEFGKLNANSLSLPFFFTHAATKDIDLIRQHLIKEFDADILEIRLILEMHLKSCNDVSACFYYVKANKIVNNVSSCMTKWMTPDEFIKKANGLSNKVVISYLNSKVEVY